MSAAMTPASLTAWDLNGWSKHHLGRVEDALSRWVGIEAPAGLGDAMRYAEQWRTRAEIAEQALRAAA